jgi:hypothetical protein
MSAVGEELRELVRGQTHPTVEDLAGLQCHAVREQPEFSLCLRGLPLLLNFFWQSRRISIMLPGLGVST